MPHNILQPVLNTQNQEQNLVVPTTSNNTRNSRSTIVDMLKKENLHLRVFTDLLIDRNIIIVNMFIWIIQEIVISQLASLNVSYFTEYLKFFLIQ